MDAPKETVDLPTVEDKDGNSHPVGLNTNKEKIYDEGHHQITKSCHICQGQHIYWQCLRGCRASYCSRCMGHCGMKVAEGISKGCPKCQDTCVCLKCLRRLGRMDVARVALPQRLMVLREPAPPSPPPELKDMLELNSADPGSPQPRQPVPFQRRTAARKATLRKKQEKRGRRKKRTAAEIDEEEDVLVERGQGVPVGAFFQEANKAMESLSHHMDGLEAEEAAASRSPQASGAHEETHVDKNDAVNGDVGRRNGGNGQWNRKSNECKEAPPIIITAPVGEGGAVLGEGNVVYTVGQPLGKKRVLDPNGMQISKSCHQCQDQHITFTCKTGKEGCKASYCRRCCDKYYIGTTYEEVMEKCPRCRGFCNCRGCLRVQWNPSTPKPSKEMTKRYAEHILKCTGGEIKEVLKTYDAEVAIDGVQLEDVEVEPSITRRINCDRCSTSIPDLFRSCETCGVDFCVECCGDLRRIFDSVTCPTCSSPLKPKKQLQPEMLEDLRAIVQEYGDCKVSASGPAWSRTPKDSADETAVSSSCQGDPNQGHWSERVDKSMVRVCSTHPDPNKKYIFCPTSSDLETSDKAHQVFQECMRRGEPVIVRNVKGVMDWRPETMCRAVVEKGNKYYGVEARVADVTVIDCTQNWGEYDLPQKTFFQDYQSKEAPTAMLKVKDWPPEEHFRDRLKRHNQDFMEMLPMKEYTNPTWGPLNMYRALPEKCLPPDLGPKTYIALGRAVEHQGEGDSVTKLHVDMSDAVNVLLNAYSRPEDAAEEKIRLGDDLWEVPSYGNAGAVWDFVRREDVEKVSEYLRMTQGAFFHNGKPVRKHGVRDPILEQMFQLRSHDRTVLQQTYGVHLWHLEQHLNEAVYIPAGVPHQVRNLKNCIKVAVDFVPPESAGQILHLAKDLRALARYDLEAGLDKLQGVATMMFAAREAYQIKSGKSHSIAIKATPVPKKTNKRAGKRRKTSEEPDEPDEWDDLMDQ